MDWWTLPLYCIDEGDGPAAIRCVYEGADGIAILAFTTETAANRYRYRSCGSPSARVRPYGRKTVNGNLIHVELAGLARTYASPDAPLPLCAMVIDVDDGGYWVSIDDVSTLGLRQRQEAKVKDELYD